MIWKKIEMGHLVRQADDIEIENISLDVDTGDQGFTTTALVRVHNKELPCWVECISSLIHLAFFGILGAITRYLLEKLFGPRCPSLTSDDSFLYLDLPSNVVGSFLMGWWGVVFKGDISNVSDQLAIGLTTGYLGSLTTFSGWNQKMLDLSVEHKWVLVVVGFLVGLFIAAVSILFGVLTAKGFKWILRRSNTSERCCILGPSGNWKVDSFKSQVAIIVVGILILGLFYILSGIWVNREFKTGSTWAELWLGCMVAPVAVWIRWWFAQLNGRGLGKAGSLKWLPFGTLLANVSASCVMAMLSILIRLVYCMNCYTILTAMDFGFCGVLSTVSAFMAELYAMAESRHPLRASAYALLTVVLCFAMGTLFYSLPFWLLSG